MITLEQYWMGREVDYRGELTDEVAGNARVTVERINHLLELVAADCRLCPESSPQTGTQIASGWRPAAVNATVPAAALKSNHIVGAACDIYDPRNTLDEWCMNHLEVLEAIGLWLEHPSATDGWCHLQIFPPGSGNRVFFP